MKRIYVKIIVATFAVIRFLSISSLHAQVEDSSLCNYFRLDSSENLGLVGGIFNDMAHSQLNGRIFLAVASAQSLFITDDTAKSWYAAFPDDSLIFECGQRGWGGGAEKIQLNKNGGVAAFTIDESNGVTSCVFSPDNGDINSWRTVLDQHIMQNMGDTVSKLFDFSLTDYYLQICGGKFIVRYHLNTNTYESLNLSDSISGIDPDSLIIMNIASTNSFSGFPIYFVVRDIGKNNVYKLFKHDGNSVTPIVLPLGLSPLSAYGLLLHPPDTSGDTLFISGTDTLNNMIRFYRTFDKGISWYDISYQNGNFKVLKDIDIIYDWQSNYIQSNGAILLLNGTAYSYDLGSTWVDFPFIDGKTAAINPNNSNYCYASRKQLGLYESANKLNGNYINKDNSYLYAQTVNKISISSDKKHVYVSTPAGIGYTTVYNDTAIKGINKWKSPYGEFPLSLTSIKGESYAVLVSPFDPDHVVAGTTGNGFIYTQTGYTGFAEATAIGLNTNSSVKIKDIKFITDDILIGVTAGTDFENKDSYGDIWRSADGGVNWNKVTPSGFNNGNVIAVGADKNDTIIYIGTGMAEINYSETQTSAKGYLWKSFDKGLNWSIVNTGPHGTNDTSVTGLPIQDILVNHNDNDSLFIASGYFKEHAVVYSINGGAAYQYINEINRKAACSALELFSSGFDTILFSIQSDIYLYLIKKDSTILIHRGYSSESMPDLQRGSIMAGTTTGFFLLGLENINEIILAIKVMNWNEYEMYIYPNPIEAEIIHLNTSFNLKDSWLELQDLFGRSLMKFQVDQAVYSYSFDLTGLNLSNGIYSLVVKTNDKKIYHRMFIAEKKK
jgi:hypothetical protein